jgi:hypothetical protein
LAPPLDSDWLFHAIEGHLEENVGHLEQEVGHLFTFLSVSGNGAQSTEQTYFIWSRPLILIGCFIPFLGDKASFAAVLPNPRPETWRVIFSSVL